VLLIRVLLFEKVESWIPIRLFELAVLFVRMLFDEESILMPSYLFELAMLFVRILFREVKEIRMP